MKNHLLWIALLAGGCGSNNQTVELQDLKTDFPTSETLTLSREIQIKDYSNPLSIYVKDSLLFVAAQNPDNFGYCYSINSGNQLATIVYKGKANCEMIHLDRYLLDGDSIQAISGNYPRQIKTFAIKDLLSNTNRSDIHFSEITLPDSLSSYTFQKMDNTKLVGSVDFWGDKSDKKYYRFDGKEVQLFGKLYKEMVESNIDHDYEDIRMLANSYFATSGDKIVSLGTASGHLEIIDKDDLTVTHKKYYSKLKLEIEKMESGRYVRSLSNISGVQVKCNDKHIYAILRKMKKNPLKQGMEIENNFILVFDWKLNPIKMYDLGNFYCCTISEDCNYAYTLEQKEEIQILREYKLNEL